MYDYKDRSCSNRGQLQIKKSQVQQKAEVNEVINFSDSMKRDLPEKKESSGASSLNNQDSSLSLKSESEDDDLSQKPFVSQMLDKIKEEEEGEGDDEHQHHYFKHRSRQIKPRHVLNSSHSSEYIQNSEEDDDEEAKQLFLR